MSTNRDELIGHIPLKDVLDAIRLEIFDAQNVANNRNIRFTIEKLELELKVDIVKKKGKKAGMSFNVFALGGSLEGQKETSSTSAHTFKFTLIPKDYNPTCQSEDSQDQATEKDLEPTSQASSTYNESTGTPIKIGAEQDEIVSPSEE